MTVLGFDPGLNRTGFAAVRDVQPPALLVSGVIAPPAGRAMEDRLAFIFREAGRVLGETRPDRVVVEDVYFSRNPQSTLKVGVVRGVLFAAALQAGVGFSSFSPAEVKMAVCGRGNATKEQVQFMIARILGVAEPIPEDSADAMALCLCYFAHRRFALRLAPDGKPPGETGRPAR